MSRSGRVAGAALGLLLLAGSLGIGSLRAQPAEFTPPPECSDPPPAPTKDEIAVEIVSPTGAGAVANPDVLVKAHFTNEDDHPVFGRDGYITRMWVAVVACEPGQVVPEAPEPAQPAGEPETATLEWSASFATNGRYALVFQAEGASPTDERQSARVVQPVTLAVPPKKPTNVEVSDPESGIVTVTWDYANPEPDLVGFEVRRARQGSGQYTTVKNGVVGPEVRSVSDAPPTGAWRYQVVAYRQGAPEGAVSRDGTVEVAEPAASASTTETTGSASPGGGGATGAGTPSTLAGSSPGWPSTTTASVDLSKFAAALNARRTTPTVRVEPPDPGFQETLPFEAPLASDLEEEPEEPGADEANVGFGQRVVADPGERQRSLGFVAFGLLLFVLSMTGLFLKSEVRRADLLDVEEVEEDPVGLENEAEAQPLADVAPPEAAAVGAARLPRRRRHATADAPVSPAPPAPPAPPVLAPPLLAAAAADRPSRRRHARMAEAPAEADPQSLTEPVSGRRRHRRPAPALPMDIPETRRRWSGRPNAAPTGPAASPETHHHFDDLADEPTPRTNGARRRTHLPDVPLDAPGLDIADPAPNPRATARTRTKVSASR